MTVQRGEQIVQQGLQTAFKGAGQKGDQNREGEHALPGKGFVVSAMRGDEVGRMDKFCKLGENAGMDTAKSDSLFYHCYSVGYSNNYITNSLT